ncbi:MAG: aminotransferase class IV [Bacteroidales bacterium]
MQVTIYAFTMSISNSNSNLSFVHNGELIPQSQLNKHITSAEKVIYEVIRVVNSTPIFLAEHIQRIENSIQLSNLEPLNSEFVIDSLKKLLTSNPVAAQNIKLIASYKTLHSSPEFTAFFIPSKYPTINEKADGIKVKTIHATRLNPEVKAENNTLRSYADEVIAKENCYEVLMIDSSELITEGSRSNVFFIKDGDLITAPNQIVLGGITREKVLNICINRGVNVHMECLHANDLSKIQGAFITGTSPGVLAINSINSITLDVHHKLQAQISNDYNALIDTEIKNWQK